MLFGDIFCGETLNGREDAKSLFGWMPGNIAKNLLPKRGHSRLPAASPASEHDQKTQKLMGELEDLMEKYPGKTAVRDKNKKEFILHSTKKTWPLVHLPYLGGFSGERCHKLSVEICQINTDALCCYGIDSRNKEGVAFLEQFGIQTNTEAIVYTLSFTGYNKYKTASWIHISTAEI